MDRLLLQLIAGLRTPATNAIGFLELVQHPAVGELSDKQREYLADALESVTALREIIDDLQELIASDPRQALH